MSVFEDLQQGQAAGRIQDLQPEVVDDQESFLGNLGQLSKVSPVGFAELHLLEQLACRPVADGVAMDACLLAQR